MAEIYMTLNQIKAAGPCMVGWKILLKALNKTEADDEPIALSFIVESNGIQDAIWCFRVNWFEHKESVYMPFVRACVGRTYDDAAVYDAAAYDAAAADAAAAAAAAAAAYDADAERAKQKAHLLSLLAS